jgi:hypothetical protein
MPSVFDKLNLKEQREIVVLHAPVSFEPELAVLAGVLVRRSIQEGDEVAFALAFVIDAAQLDAAARALTAQARGDAILWFAYPKRSSKRYQSELHRDIGWEALGAAGFEPVRQVAIDEDWSAVRFRRVEHIKTFRRKADDALSAAGKDRAAAQDAP